MQLGGKADTGSTRDGRAASRLGLGGRVLSGKSDGAILDECERGEDAAMERYRDAIKANLPSDVMAVVQRQYEGVKHNHNQIRRLRDQVHAVS